MWIAEFKVWHSGSDGVEFSRNFDAILSNVNLNLFKEKGKTYVMRCASFSGPQANEFKKMFKVDSQIKIVGGDSNQVFFYHPADLAFHTLLFDKSLFFVGPIITKGGFQYWKVAALKKTPLLSLFKRVEKLGPKRATIKLLSLCQEQVNVFSQGVLSELTALQLKAVQLASRHGYYAYPRKVNLEQLAKIAKVPRTTLQSHLRRAERTLIPKLLGNLQ
ncbi:MAG: helix-turn-helix domain-containing protein [Candidatus Micrarchaeota archaeon]|nr:helix-turn-helix domain-containing protein [Candidatus Micrarchaeota archaeon]